MPIFFQNKIAVTYEELIPQYINSIGTIKSALSRAKKRGYGLTALQRGGGKDHDALIDFDSLPIWIQNAIGDPRKINHILERFYVTDKEAIEFYLNYQFADHTYLDDKTQEQYITNASMLKAVKLLKVAREQERLSKGGSVHGIWQTLCADALSFNPILKQKWGVEHNLPENYRRFQAKYQLFEKGGYLTLIHKGHKNDNGLKVTQNIEELLNNMFADAKNKPTKTEIARKYDGFLSGYVEIINPETGEIYNPKEFPKLSQGTILNYLSEWSNEIGTIANRSGDRQKLMQQFRPHHSMKQPEFAGSIISIDDRQPPFEYSKGMRMWFYNAIDLGSEAFTVWVYGKTKEGIILDFYRQMVRNYAEWGYNIPAEIECEMSLNSVYAKTFLQEGRMFEYVRMEANNARGKRIEAYYKQLRYGLEKKREGWLARPFALSESNQAGPEKVQNVPYDELIQACLKDIETWNNMPHSQYKDLPREQQKTRWEVFTEKQNKNVKPTNYRAILPYLGYKEQTSCSAAGIVKLQGKEWLLGDKGQIYFGEKLIALMEQVAGAQLDVYWLDGNDGKVLNAIVYLKNETQYICELLAKPTYHRATIEQTDEDLQARTIMSKYENTINGMMNRTRKAIEELVIIDKTPVTLNNKFQIGGMKQPKEFNTSKAIETFERETELMPALVDEELELELNGIETSFKNRLIDRF